MARPPRQPKAAPPKPAPIPVYDVPRNDSLAVQKSVYLPNEIILEVLSYVPRRPSSQYTLYSCCLVSRQWYNAAIARLYENPHLEGHNFNPFIRTICPSINVHVKKSDLAELVRVLDLRYIVHQSSKSVTARLLGRVKKSLEIFIAPQASFAVNCFAALSKCTKLHTLDLSLLSEAITLSSLAHTLKQLNNLKVLYFPRSSNDSEQFQSQHMRWPPQLRELHLSGSIHGYFINGLGNPLTKETFLPKSLTMLSLGHCPRLKESEILGLLLHVGPQLRSLTIENIRDLNHQSLDGVLKLCPDLTHLCVSLDYITFNAFDNEFLQMSSCALQQLDLSSSGDTGPRNQGDIEIEPLDLVESISQGFFPDLRVVRIAKSARWHLPPIVEDTQQLVDALNETQEKRASEDHTQRGKEIGVWTIDDE